MSLLTKNEQTTATLAQGVEKIAGHISASIRSANKLAYDLLALNNEDLTDWLNSKPIEKRLSEFAAHGLIGQYLNDTAEQVETFISTSLGRVDTRSFQDKLADQNRELTITESGFSVTSLPIIVPEIVEVVEE